MCELFLLSRLWNKQPTYGINQSNTSKQSSNQHMHQSTYVTSNQQMEQAINQSSNQAINRWNQSIKHIQTIKQSTDASINQAIKQSSKHGLYTIHTYMHVYIMCALSVCVCVCAIYNPHIHACALHLCIALLCVHLSACDCSQQALLQNVKNPWAPW